MGRIQWDQPGERLYEVGLDRGVLYLEDLIGVPWNGLISVDDILRNDSTDAFFFDGNKYAQPSSFGDFAAKIKAFTYPEEFVEYTGYAELDDGLYLGNQHKKSFGLSYRTLIGDDLVGQALGYKIHILYNLSAIPDDLSYDTIDDNINPIEFEWVITSQPERSNGNAPTAHVIADSRYTDEAILSVLEDILYGSETNEPTLPSLDTLEDLDALIIIVDHGDGTWSAIGPDELITEADGTFEITDANATYLDSDTYTISSTF